MEHSDDKLWTRIKARNIVAMLNHKYLSKNDIVLYLYLKMKGWKWGKADPCFDTISKRLNMHKYLISQSTHRLDKYGYIKIKNNGYRNFYTFKDQPMSDDLKYFIIKPNNKDYDCNIKFLQLSAIKKSLTTTDTKLYLLSCCYNDENTPKELLRKMCEIYHKRYNNYTKNNSFINISNMLNSHKEVFQQTVIEKESTGEKPIEFEEEPIVHLKTMPYKEYLQTDEWKKRREKHLKVANYKCQLCNSGGNLNVHHRTYERVGREDFMDLIVLCEKCHSLFHESRKLC
jgi:hypothetical protein